MLVHRLVAEAYCPHPEGKDNVMFIDGDKTHIYASNLKWATDKECCNNGDRNKRISKTKGLRVKQYDKQGHLIWTYHSIAEATKATGVNGSSISKVCKGKMKTSGGYI